jgi:hypothetical protein
MGTNGLATRQFRFGNGGRIAAGILSESLFDCFDFD